MTFRILAGLTATAVLAAGTPANAQQADSLPLAVAAPAEAVVPAIRYIDSASPFGPSEVTNADAAAVPMPQLAFTPDPAAAEGYDKYYFFHREGTDFATAYADIRECDGYARGIQSGIEYVQVPYPYSGTLGGAVGGMIADVMVEAIFGSAEKRRLRRVSLRTCMGYKGYARYGLTKALWEAFNFEEGFADVADAKRDRYLRQQALVAASTKPETMELGL